MISARKTEMVVLNRIMELEEKIRECENFIANPKKAGEENYYHDQKRFAEDMLLINNEIKGKLYERLGES